MCLIIFSYDMHPLYRLILAANRDEYYNRPTAPLSFWDDEPGILAGRDLKGNGTWLGVTRTGRIAAITNFRETGFQIENAPSRGHLISNFLVSKESPKTYMEHVKSMGHKFNGFNLFIGDRSELFYYSNRKNHIEKLKPGLYGVSNRFLNTPWPKVTKAKTGLKKLIDNTSKESWPRRRPRGALPRREDQALVVPRGDLVCRHLTIYGVLEYWSNGRNFFFITLRKYIPGKNLKV